MLNGCDICLPQHHGYTVYFVGGQSIDQLKKYFRYFSEEKWFTVNEKTFWTEEPIFFDLLDYLEGHMEPDKVFAVSSKKAAPLQNLDEMKRIGLFRVERQASWIDQIIEERSIRTHYQPIVSVKNNQVDMFGYELLSRGIDEKGDLIPPFKMFEAARVRNRLFALDRICRLESVKNASNIDITNKMIFINFIPTAIYVPEHCLSTTFELIKKVNLKPEQVVFEVVETDEVEDIEHLKSILNYYKSHGFKYALDDVGTGVNDLKKLSSLEPHFVKLAREFSDGVSEDLGKQHVAESVLQVARDINAKPLAEGVERSEDIRFLADIGYELFQGYYFAKPQENPTQHIDQEFRG
ncbi:EAL domain-containing protein [Halobacillus amylolyticus]|uniref:EAL domain-containing protein n=1 Tax=Halobacillus amylolyticus TaxID=2932259 RepID=A0ABY4H7G8_9BACI|nr:EAL domain-containing protein [Halobacillus amylolyticus]UOR10810.1 EAL domain-containing protein [Halobacillus amylolyticus]